MRPRIIVSTVVVMAGAVLAVTYVPWFQPYFGLRNVEYILPVILAAAGVSYAAHRLFERGDEYWPWFLSFVDTPLYAFVPILVAYWSENPMGVAFALGCYGVMSVIWARTDGWNLGFAAVVLSPPLLLITRLEELPWLALEYALFVAIYLVVAMMEHGNQEKQEELHRAEIDQMVADAVRGAFRQAEIAAITEARLHLHELSNILNPGTTCLGIFEEITKDLDEETRDAFKMIRRALLRSSDSIKHSLTYFVPSGRVEVSELDDVLENLDLMLAKKARPLRPRIIGPTDDIVLRGKRNVLAGCLLNLIRNSEEANATQITFNFFPRENHVVLRVEDNGNGIPPDVRDYLFQPEISAGKNTGAGHALNIIRVILETLGGEIRTIPTTNPQGAVFELKLPRATKEDLAPINAPDS